MALAAASAALASGCASPKNVTATYLIPARALTDVRSADILEIAPVVRLSGGQAAPGDEERLAAYVRQSLSSRLYLGGFYRTVDPFLDSQQGAVAIGRVLMLRESRHGYSTLVPEGMGKKATLEIGIDLEYSAEKTTRKQTFELKTVPYIVNKPGEGGGAASKLAGEASSVPGGEKLAALAGAVSAVESLVPYSVPDPTAVETRRVETSWDAWVPEVSGRMTVRLVPAGASDPVYEREFPLSAPFQAGSDVPTFLRAASTAVSPALVEVVADISPRTEKRPLSLNADGDSRALLLLEAGAWPDAVERLESLPADRAVLADWENLGVAYEILGDFKGSSEAYEKALALDPENSALVEKLEALAKAAKARKDVRASGARENADTSYKAGRHQ